MPFYRFMPRAFHATLIPGSCDIRENPVFPGIKPGEYACIGPDNCRFVLSAEAMKALSFPVMDVTDEELTQLHESHDTLRKTYGE